MIERINLIQRDPFIISYEKLLLGVMLVILLSGGMFGFQFFRIKMNTREIANLKSDVTRLKAEQEALMKAAESEVQIGPTPELRTLFDKAPIWSRIIKDLSQRLPGNVWLLKISTTTDSTEPTRKKITIAGLARNVTDLSEFLTRIKESAFLMKPTLKSSKKVEQGFTFEVECDIVVPR